MSLFAAVLCIVATGPATVPTPPTLPSTGPLAPASDDPAATPIDATPIDATPDVAPTSDSTPAAPADESHRAPADAAQSAPAVPASASATPSPASGHPAADTPYPAAPQRWVPAPTDDEDPLAVAAHDDAVADDPHDAFDRRGVFLSLSAGVANCREPICADITIAGHGRFEIGYRVGMFAPFVGLSGGGSKIKVDDFSTPSEPVRDGTGAMRFFDIGAGVAFAPNKQGRLDPFFIAALGYSRVREEFESGARATNVTLSRAGLRLGTGLSVYVARHVALAPRFDIVLPFAGRVCTVQDEPLTTHEQCDDVRDVVDAQDSTAGERLTRKSLPRPWSAALDVRLVF